MNARKYARGSRRPGGRGGKAPRVRGAGRKGSSANKGCALVLVALAALPAIVAAVWR